MLNHRLRGKGAVKEMKNDKKRLFFLIEWCNMRVYYTNVVTIQKLIEIAWF